MQNLLALYGVQAVNYLFPLLTLPYLARVLGPEKWGLLAVVTSLAQYFSLAVEYGFTLSATREVAQRRGDKARLAQILAGVLGARVSLAFAVLLLAWGVLGLVPNLGQDPRLFWAGVFWGVTLGFSPLWFFQGLERLRLVALLEVGVRALGFASIFLLVRSPSDAWLVPLAQGVAGVLATGVALGLAWREVGFVLPHLGQIVQALRSGFNLFFFRAAVSLYTVGNVFILGLLLPPQLVAYYAGAERLIRAFLGLLEPLSRVFFPRISGLVSSDLFRASRLASWVALVMGVVGLALGIGISVLAPWLTLLFLGLEFGPTVQVMRVLFLILPLIALGISFGILWMVPLGLDGLYTRIILSAGILNVVLAPPLVVHFSYLGMAYSVVLAEFWVVVTTLWSLWLKGQAPWQVSKKKEKRKKI